MTLFPSLILQNIWDEIPSEKTQKINQIQNLHASQLFCQKMFKQAMSIFMQLGTGIVISKLNVCENDFGISNEM
jgi:hypothetical protein